MKIREQLEQLESETLSPFAAQASKTAGRNKPEPECNMRTCYQRDRDRIIHSKAFRRLMHKTQVFLSPAGDHYRTRLTHTLEVSQIARTMAKSLRLNEDLTEAIALGHDLGHAPFGHAGERALNQICVEGFRHNLQSVRVVELYERGGKGLNLTKEVKNGILCHSKNENRQADTLEGRLVQFADRIAYTNHDLEDAIRAGILRESDLPSVVTRVLGSTKSQRITAMVTSIVQNSTDDIQMGDRIFEAYDALYCFMRERLYKNSKAKNEEEKVHDLIMKLYRYYEEHLDELPSEYYETLSNQSASLCICDYISGMTDQYILRKYNELFIPRGWEKE